MSIGKETVKRELFQATWQEELLQREGINWFLDGKEDLSIHNTGGKDILVQKIGTKIQ